MTDTFYRDYQAREAAPPWLRRALGDGFLSSLGETKDELVARAKESVKARLLELGPDDALPVLGLDSQMERGPNETADGFRARMLDRWNHHTWRGLEKGVEDALRVYGLTDARMYTRRDSDPFDDNTNWWSRFWVFVFSPPWTNILAGDAVPAAEESLAGTTMTLSELRTLRRIIHTARSGHELGVELVLIYDEFTVAGPDAFAGEDGKAGGDTCSLPIGRCVGVGQCGIAGDQTICGYYFP